MPALTRSYYSLLSETKVNTYLELGSLNRAISLGVERTLFSVESASRTLFLAHAHLNRRVLNRRVAVAKDASPWQKQALNKLDASSMETTRIREPQGPLVASSLRSERYSPGPLRLSNARSFLDSTSNLYVDEAYTVTLKLHTNTDTRFLVRACGCACMHVCFVPSDPLTSCLIMTQGRLL